MEQFKKRRVKKRAKVQRRTLRADDLIPDATAADHGSRSLRQNSHARPREEGEVEEAEDGGTRAKQGEEEDVKGAKLTTSSSALSTTAGLDPAIAALLSAQTVEEEAPNGGEDDAGGMLYIFFV